MKSDSLISPDAKKKVVIQARGISKSFETSEGKLEVLSNLNLKVGEREMIAIVGESGVGKSTLLSLLGGLDKPTAGTLCYDDLEITELNEDQLCRFRNANIGYVFQMHHLLEDFTALENVSLPAMVAGKSREEACSMAEELLSVVGLSNRKTHLPSKLSGGEKQRVAVARAMVNDPRVILADEPSGNLDTKTGEKLHDLMDELNRERGRIIVIATHNTDLAKRCHTVYNLSEGVLTAQS